MAHLEFKFTEDQVRIGVVSISSIVPRIKMFRYFRLDHWQSWRGKLLNQEEMGQGYSSWIDDDCEEHSISYFLNQKDLTCAEVILCWKGANHEFYLAVYGFLLGSYL